ncbi:TetR/AcrR family transcriptional regulator [Pantoea agglomerans]|uniref:TetR/AcrR family transcriptional regulator n=1 Tax=Enterobacter agglomerans TaxID=549 RepID=UPI00301D644A
MKRHRSILFSVDYWYTRHMTDKPKTNQRSKVGRPRREAAGDVDTRILSAATALFLEKGLAATSCEAVVARAKVGKASLYSRYSGKNELFEAVIRQAIDSSELLLTKSDIPTASLRTRLAIAGKAILRQAIEPVPLGLMRLFLTEAQRFNGLIQSFDLMARDRAIEIVSESLMEDDMLSKVDANALTRHFLDLTFAPIMLAALVGHSEEISSEAIDKRIEHALNLLEKSGYLTGNDASKSAI